MHVNLHADANEQWNEAPITVHEGGTQSGGTGHLFLFPRSRVVLFDTGAQVRQLKIAAEGTPEKPTANQFLGWTGIDFNLWTTPTRVVRAEVLDEKLVRRVYLTDAGVHRLPALRAVDRCDARFPHLARAARIDRQRDADHPQGAGRRPDRFRSPRRRRLRPHP